MPSSELPSCASPSSSRPSSSKQAEPRADMMHKKPAANICVKQRTLKVSCLRTSCVKRRNLKGVVPLYLLCEAKKPWWRLTCVLPVSSTETLKALYLRPSCVKKRISKGVLRRCRACVYPVSSEKAQKVSYLGTSFVKQRNPKGFVPVYFLCQAKKP